MVYSTKDIIDFYIELSKESFKHCYHGWQRDRRKNIHHTRHAFANGKDNDLLESAVLACDNITGQWLEDLTTKRGFRLYDWPKDYESELRNGLSTSLQANGKPLP